MFRYGRDDMDVMGLAFRRDIYLSTRQIYPALQDKKQCTLTKVQEKLLRKLGDNAYPFFFECSTIGRQLHHAGPHAHRPLPRLSLTPRHRHQRLQWCRTRLSWSDSEWQRVVFSDESRFSLGGDAQRIRVWRHRGQHQDERFVVTRPEDLVLLHLHPYRTICGNCVRIFELHGMDYHRTPLGTSAAPYRDVWFVGLANILARRHTERQTSFPDNLPSSVGLQPAPKDVGKRCSVPQHCAVEFEVKAFSAESQDAKVRKRSTVRLMIRKVQYAPENTGPAPTVSVTRDFLMSDKPLHVEASLEKQTFYHGEPIHVHVDINNESSKSVKNIILSVDQTATVVLYSNDSYIKSVDLLDSGDYLGAGGKMEKVYTLLPLLSNNKERRGIALDGKLKHEDTNLASSSVIKEGVLKEVLGILVSYRVMVKLIVGG
ncbi:hypothetical protein NFI96_021558 [Prochilodus magdalenae]|nr:hypothetical protein NFI96_021558 [Prochilodus magdalenae]